MTVGRAVEEDAVKLSYLWRGLPGHPAHPPLTDATIGIYTFALAAAVADVTGVSDDAAAHGWWLALIAAFVATAPTALTGLIDWLGISRGTPLWRTATWHMAVMLTATGVFAVAAATGHASFEEGDVAALPFVLTAIGFVVLAVGGWLGGTIVFVHGMRVLNLVEEPTHRAAAPVPSPEKESAEAG
jgi:uncharacterized membrane protein